VKNLLTEQVEITAQNHGFCVDPDLCRPAKSKSRMSLERRHHEGMRHKSKPLFSVQYTRSLTRPSRIRTICYTSHRLDERIRAARQFAPLKRFTGEYAQAERHQEDLIIGSGPIIIGKLAIDYSGAQACKRGGGSYESCCQFESRDAHDRRRHRTYIER